jgi:hypothetical protein
VQIVQVCAAIIPFYDKLLYGNSVSFDLTYCRTFSIFLAGFSLTLAGVELMLHLLPPFPDSTFIDS